MRTEQLAEIRARVEAAAPGPWAETCMGSEGYHVHEATRITGKRRKRLALCTYESWETDKANAAFIAHAREDVPALLAEVERLAGAVAAATELVRQSRGSYLFGGAWAAGTVSATELAAALGCEPPHPPPPLTDAEKAEVGTWLDEVRAARCGCGGEPVPSVPHLPDKDER